MFIDRTNELDYLESEYSKPHANLIVIYGRRRVGKTTLITTLLGSFD
jgi:AAA+ ATPase superfamily predicted ATPase